jgi:hypothetical protein
MDPNRHTGHVHTQKHTAWICLSTGASKSGWFRLKSWCARKGSVQRGGSAKGASGGGHEHRNAHQDFPHHACTHTHKHTHTNTHTHTHTHMHTHTRHQHHTTRRRTQHNTSTTPHKETALGSGGAWLTLKFPAAATLSSGASKNAGSTVDLAAAAPLPGERGARSRSKKGGRGKSAKRRERRERQVWLRQQPTHKGTCVCVCVCVYVVYYKHGDVSLYTLYTHVDANAYRRMKTHAYKPVYTHTYISMYTQNTQTQPPPHKYPQCGRTPPTSYMAKEAYLYGKRGLFTQPQTNKYPQCGRTRPTFRSVRRSPGGSYMYTIKQKKN